MVKFNARWARVQSVRVTRGYCDKFIILLIILMATRLEKLEKIKLPSAKAEVVAGVPPVTQTIIINNPNININYMNDSARTNGPMSSRGLDNWNLNNNLKEVASFIFSSVKPDSLASSRPANNAINLTVLTSSIKFVLKT